MPHLDNPVLDKLRTIFSLHRVKTVALALLVIWIVLILFLTIALPATAIQTLAGVLIEHGNYIRITNAVVALMCAAFFLWPKAGGQLVGGWSFYVGLAFLTFFVQYGMRTIGFTLESYVLLLGHVELNGILRAATAVVVYVGSSLNNVLLLAAARILLHKNSHTAQETALDSDDKRTVKAIGRRVRDAFARLYAALPLWVWPVFPAVTVIALFENSPGEIFLFARFPDALFSLYCLSWFGYAVALNFWVREQKALACLAFCVTLAYGAGQLVYAANPLIAQTIISDTESSIPRVRQTVRELNKNVVKFVGRYFEADDFINDDKLVCELNGEQSPFSESFMAATRALGPAEAALKGAESALPESSAANPRKVNILVLRLNYLLNQPSIYKPDSLGGIKLRRETQALLERTLQDGDLIQVRNRLLLTDVYPEHIKSAGTPGEALDNAIFAVLFPMKYLLFLPAFVLYLLSIISANNFRQALRDTTRKRADYLSNEGILNVVGKSLNADEVDLLIRLPGVQRRQGPTEERVLAETWRAPGMRSGRRVLRVYPLKDDHLLVEVMKEKGEVKFINDRSNCKEAAEMRRAGGLFPKTQVIIPIRFHGGIIGALRVFFSGYGKYHDGTLEQLKFMAELIAPSAQDFRTVSAIDKLGGRLIRTLVEDLSLNRTQPSGETEDQDGEAAIKKLVSWLYDLLAPLGICLIVDCGFTSVRRIFPEDGIYYEILKKQEVSFANRGRRVVSTAQGPVRIETDQLSGSNERGYKYYLGALLLAIPRDKDHFTQPTLAAHYLTRRMLASLVANGILSAARIFLSGIIQDLGVAFNKETLTFNEWFREIETKVKKSGLLWVVASGGEGRPLRGEQEHIELLSRLTDEEQETLLRTPLSCIVQPEPEHAARHIIHLKLDNTEARIWLGVEREGFGVGPELNFKSPWRDFLEELSKVAGAAFASIEDRQSHEARRRREEEERLKGAEDEWLKTIAVISAMLMHQLVNMVRNQLDTAEDLLETLGRDSLEASGQAYESIVAIKESAEMMQALTNACSNLTRTNEPHVCDVGEAAQQAKNLFQFGIRKKKIEVRIDIPPDASAKIPPNVCILALASLVGNAIDAVKAKGNIEIKAEFADGFVLCHVVNDGQVIPTEIRKNMFRLGTTSKLGHSGWGLYLVSRVLEKYGGEIYLSDSDTQATCLTLRLPASED